jgi:O-antigen ligase
MILTQSRGGFLALVAAGVCAWLAAPKAYRRFVSIAGVLAGVLLLMLSDDAFWQRVSTIFESSDNTGQETRVQLIGPQLQMFLDYPFGAGHRGNELLSPQYMPPELLTGDTGTRSAHATFIAALVDQGVPGAVLLLSLYAWAFFTVRRLRRLDGLGLPAQLGLHRAALGAALASLVVSGLFLNLLKTEVQIWLIALLASLVGLCEAALAAQRREGTPLEPAPTPGRDAWAGAAASRHPRPLRAPQKRTGT